MAGGHSGGHARPGAHASLHAHLHIPGHSIVHRLDPAIKLAGTVAFVVAMAFTPRQAWPVFAVDAAVIVAVAGAAQLRPGTLLARLTPVVPFLLMAAFIPFVAEGPDVDVFGVGLSRGGLWAAFGIAAKALIGATATIVLVATTPLPELIRGLGRLRVPTVIVAIVTFMFRYLDLLVDQLRRMRTAMVARCHDPRWLWQAKPIATAAGSLFVRSYERGERVHMAMLARGYDGTMPDLGAHHDHGHDRPTSARGHRSAPSLLAFVPAAAAAAAVLVWVAR